MNATHQPRMPAVVLILGMVIPTLITWVYFDLLASAPAIAQSTAYVLGKLSQVGILLVALRIWRKTFQLTPDDKPLIRRSIGKDWLVFGGLLGLVIGCTAVGVFQWVLMPLGVMEPVKVAATEKLQRLGADSPAILLAIALFYVLLHSGFEELYWRGFVFRGLNEHLATAPANCLSSLAFMSHHVLVLAKYFGFGSIMTYLLAISVAIGGMIWAALYKRCGSLIPGWISHALVDAAIFVIAYQMVFA